MGLLDRAIAILNTDTGAALGDIQSLIVDFNRANPLFHCIVLQGDTGDIAAMMADHGAVCAGLPGTRSLVLLPGALDGELFAHRLSHSAGQAVLCQTSVNSSSLAIETLDPYLR